MITDAISKTIIHSASVCTIILLNQFIIPHDKLIDFKSSTILQSVYIVFNIFY